MDKKFLDRHISHSFDNEIETIITQILEMGNIVEQQIVDSVKAIISTNKELAQKVVQVEDDVDMREVRLDELCTEVLACRQPAAFDLRMVLSATRIIRDLERIGDEAQKVAKMAIRLEKKGAAPAGYEEVAHMGGLVQSMLSSALSAFSQLDVTLALDVAKADKKVDRELKSAMRTIVNYMIDEPKSIKRAMNILSALRSLERMGNHSRNIAEHVIYLVKGLDVRHSSIKEIASKLAE
ncbi:MAG: phosphate signaling complex protein PhoU [Glaciecola sp.]|jgi:phosphate transport system protein|nr:phosphate signaling complex protein PhoU [Glaciecola sp.]MDG2098235.1 phosphate signaling complex protein PhoU [Glaciecola sp.]